MGYIKIAVVVALTPLVASADSHAIRPDALDILEMAEERRNQILESESRIEAILNLSFDQANVLEIVAQDRNAAGLRALNQSERSEIVNIIAELEEGRKEAIRVLEEGEIKIREEIELAAKQATERAKFERAKRRNAMYLQLFKDVIGVSAAFSSAHNQSRMQEFRGSPKAPRKTMHSAYGSRSVASAGDFVSEDSGMTIEEIFNPLRGDPADLDFFESLPARFDLCVEEGFDAYDKMFPTWEAGMPNTEGLAASQASIQVGIYWDCGVLGRRSPLIAPTAHESNRRVPINRP